MTEPNKPWLRPGERNILKWLAVVTMLFLTVVVAIFIVTKL